jgi:hypothetical protein
MAEITESFDALADALRNDGLLEEADRVQSIVNREIWVSELYGELGLELKKIKIQYGHRFSPATREHYERVARMVRTVFPAMEL